MHVACSQHICSASLICVCSFHLSKWLVLLKSIVVLLFLFRVSECLPYTLIIAVHSQNPKDGCWTSWYWHKYLSPPDPYRQHQCSDLCRLDSNNLFVERILRLFGSEYWEVSIYRVEWVLVPEFI